MTLYYKLLFNVSADIIEPCRSLPDPRAEVIQHAGRGIRQRGGRRPGCWTRRWITWPATDWASLGTQAHGEMLAQLQRAQAKLTAVNAAVLAAFTAQSGYEPDGHRSARAWLINKTGICQGARRRRGRLAETPEPAPADRRAMAAGDISESWAPGDRRLDRQAARGQARRSRPHPARRRRGRAAAYFRISRPSLK